MQLKKLDASEILTFVSRMLIRYKTICAPPPFLPVDAVLLDIIGNEHLLSSCTLSDVQLVSGRTASSGRLQVYHRSRWGTVCDDGFGDTDARVACRQLGYSMGRTLKNSAVPDGSGNIWLDDVSTISATCLGRSYL